jgi:biopolymer transport protein ExbD
MARAKKCEEEFNPWPPFVDVFSSVILVLLLFILVTIVNVAYYMQFNSKTNSQATTSSSKESLQAGKDVQDMVSLAKVVKPADDAKGNDSLFTGGASSGNAISITKTKDQKESQQVEKGKAGEITIAYEDKEIFINQKIKDSIATFIKAEKKKNKNAKFEISVAQPTRILGNTIPKQISLGRALNIKNMVKKMGVKLSDMQLKMQKNRDKNYGFGYVKIKVVN